MKLYRFRTSPYAHKVQIVLDLMGASYELVDVAYGDRDELALLTGGYIHVPVLVDDAGAVIEDSRVICERLLASPAGARLLPSPWEGPISAYADFIEGALEDVLFRIATPAIRHLWPRPFERALFVLVKERKYGPGCVDAWERERPELVARARRLLDPTLRTLGARPFLFGDEPTLADAALYGQCMMLEVSNPASLGAIAEPLVAFARRLEARASRPRG
jgi:glutathione S-transferase